MKLNAGLIGLGLVSSLLLQGCYTQLAMFHPEPVYDQDGEEEFYDTYSKAPRRPGLQGLAQDRSNAMPLGYSSMQNRFNPFFGYGDYGYLNPYNSFYNPYYYNGLKLFCPDGLKLSDKIEKKIESLIDSKITKQLSKSQALGRVKRLENGNEEYIKIIKKNFPKKFTLKGLKIVIDCANGAAYKSGPLLLKSSKTTPQRVKARVSAATPRLRVMS